MGNNGDFRWIDVKPVDLLGFHLLRMHDNVINDPVEDTKRQGSQPCLAAIPAVGVNIVRRKYDTLSQKFVPQVKHNPVDHWLLVRPLDMNDWTLRHSSMADNV